jgi:periplasmic divalent cation tolerance protein
LVLTTAGSDDEAAAIARALVERRLAACVNVVPGIASVYCWQGEVVQEEERLLLIKTMTSRVEAVREAVLELHSYETPELIVLAIESGDPDYLDWLAAAVD